VAFLHIKTVCEVLETSCRPSRGHTVSRIAVGAVDTAGTGFGGLPKSIFFGQLPDGGRAVQLDFGIVSVGIHEVFRSYASVLRLILHGRNIAGVITKGFFQPFAVGSILSYGCR